MPRVIRSLVAERPVPRADRFALDWVSHVLLYPTSGSLDSEWDKMVIIYIDNLFILIIILFNWLLHEEI